MSVYKKTVSDEAMQEEWLEIQKAKENPVAFKPLYNRYYEPIFLFIFRRTGDESLTADICSQVFLKALQSITSYEYKGVPFSAWLFRIASNEVSQHFREEQKNRVVSLEDHHVADLMDEIIENSKDDQNEVPILIKTINELKRSEIQLLELRFFEKLPFKEIAEILDITESNAKVRTYRLLEKMKKRINKKRL